MLKAHLEDSEKHTVVTVSPTCGSSSHKVYIGLILQYHCVCNNSCVTNIIYDCNVDNMNVDSALVRSTDELNDEVIAQGDQNQCQTLLTAGAIE